MCTLRVQWLVILIKNPIVRKFRELTLFTWNIIQRVHSEHIWFCYIAFTGSTAGRACGGTTCCWSGFFRRIRLPRGSLLIDEVRPWALALCALREQRTRNRWSQTWQAKGLSPVWMRSWVRKLSERENLLAQMRHWCWNWSVWVTRCTVRAYLAANRAGHSGHWNGFMPWQRTSCSRSDECPTVFPQNWHTGLARLECTCRWCSLKFDRDL